MNQKRIANNSVEIKTQSEKGKLEIKRIGQGLIHCKFPNDNEIITLKHYAHFDSILPDFYSVY